MTLLQASCLEILCLRAGLRYDAQRHGFPLRNQHFLTRMDLLAKPELALLAPLFSYASRLQDLQLGEAEVALLAATWVLQSSRPDLYEPERVEVYQDSMASMAAKLSGKQLPSGEELRWLKSIMTRPPPLKGFTVAQQPDKCAIYVSIEHVTQLPVSFIHLFEEHS